MEVRVLGCYGGEMPGRRTTCFMINGNVLIDAGAITGALDLKEQAGIDAIALTHSHLDHVRDIGFMVDNVFGQRDRPTTVYGLPESIKSLREHVLNDLVWPDFSKLPTPDKPVLKFQEIGEGEQALIEGLKVTPIKVNHTIAAAGYLVSNGSKSLAFSGDTGPTEKLWKAIADIDGLAGLFLETSFPNRLTDLANNSGHLTPSTAQLELDKLGRSDVPVYLYHMKPQYLKEIEEEVEAADYPMRLLEQGDLIEF